MHWNKSEPFIPELIDLIQSAMPSLRGKDKAWMQRARTALRIYDTFGPEIAFAETWKDVALKANDIAIDKGFWLKERSAGEMIALIHSEISEALEALRKGNPPDSHCPDHASVAVELADAIIRIMDMAEGLGYEIAPALLAKMRFNASRAKLHGKEF